MSLTVNPIVSFQSNPQPSQSKVVSEPVYFKQDNQPVKQQGEKKGFITRLKDGFINFRKALINVGAVAKGVAVGVAKGAVGVTSTLGAAVLYNAVKKVPADQVRKTLTTGNKVLAGAVGLGILAVELIKARLFANQKGSDLDHKWHTGHNS